MKRERRWIRLKIPTEGQAFAEFGELLSALSHNLINFTTEDAAAAAKIFFAPAVRKMLTHANSLGEAGKGHTQAGEKRKTAALIIAARLMAEQKLLRLPGKRQQVAKLVRKELIRNSDKDGKQPAVRTIRRWITEALNQKK